MQLFLGSPWKFLGGVIALSACLCVGIDTYQNWKAPVTQALQTACEDDPSKRYKAPNKEAVYYDCDKDGKPDWVSTGLRRIRIVPTHTESVPIDYYVSRNSQLRTYFGPGTLVPEGAIVYEHLADNSREAQKYLQAYAEAKTSNNPRTRGQTAFPHPDIWE